MSIKSIKSVIQNLAAGAVADRIIEHVVDQAREPVISENPPRVSGWKQHNVPGHEPTWSCPPWTGASERSYTATMGAITSTLREAHRHYTEEVAAHRRTAEAYAFTSQTLPGDLHSLPKSIAEQAKVLLKSAGWL